MLFRRKFSKFFHKFFSRRVMESEEEEEDSSANAIPSEELNIVIKDLTIR